MKKPLDLTEVVNELTNNTKDYLHAIFLKESKDFSKF